MKAGRELDALIAEKVMGLTVDREFDDMPTAKELRDKYDENGIVPFYSTEIAAAWEVVEKIKQGMGEGFELAYEEDCENGWCWTAATEFDYDGAANSVVAQTAPLAICRAALKMIKKKEMK